MKRLIILLMLGLLSGVSQVQAHCEVPCGIYDDKARTKEIHEHITTLSKAMAQINELSASGDKNYNQIVRWVTNKEKHATEIQNIVFQYFMTQRIKPVDPNDSAAVGAYNHKLTLLHHLLVHAMKAKQTTDQAHVKKLYEVLGDFEKAYFDGDKGSKGSDKGSKGSH